MWPCAQWRERGQRERVGGERKRGAEPLRIPVSSLHHLAKPRVLERKAEPAEAQGVWLRRHVPRAGKVSGDIGRVSFLRAARRHQGQRRHYADKGW